MFVITGPSTDGATVVGATTFGVLGAGKDVAVKNQCLTDTFTVTNPGGPVPPTICGTNTNDHSKSIDMITNTCMVCVAQCYDFLSVCGCFFRVQ